MQSGGLGVAADMSERLRTKWKARLASEARAAVGRAQGMAGLDDRPGVGLLPNGLPDIDWVEIPGGRVLYQEEKKRRAVHTFYMAR